MRDTLIRLLESTVTGIGCELVELEVGQSGHRPLVRVYIDRLDGDDHRTVSTLVGQSVAPSLKSDIELDTSQALS